MRTYLFILFLISTRLSFAKSNNNIYLKFQSGITLNNHQKHLGYNHSLVIDFNRKLQIEASYVGNRNTKFLPYYSLNDYSRNYNIGLSYQLKEFSLKNTKYKCLIGGGYSYFKYREVDYVIDLDEGLFGTGIAYNATKVLADGIYIKPQLQSRPNKNFEYNLHLFANVNGYKNVYGLGLSMNLFRIKMPRINEIH
jgi:hypothetical protein